MSQEKNRMDSFNELNIRPDVKKGIDAAGYRRPFPIQEKAIGPLLVGRNLIGQAKAGSGKTLAFGIPLVQSIDQTRLHVQALVLAPTRELAVQITLELQKIGSYTGVRVVTIYGGQSINLQFDALRRGAHVVVGTPGRVIDHLKRGTLNLKDARYVVLDEADTMLDMGFIDDVDYILGRTRPGRQLSLFSATMPSSIIRLSQKYMTDPEKVIVDADQPSSEFLEQYYARVPREKKLELAMRILEKVAGSSVIFCRTRHGTTKLARELQRNYQSVVALHGDLSQKQRDHSMDLFRSGDADVLVATDVASRGIDVRQVACVINYDVPEDPAVYFHRVGRTARAGDPGKAYTFVSDDEASDFGRILAQAKTPVNPLRPEDEKRPIEAGRGPRVDWRQRRHFRRDRGKKDFRSWKRYR